jgi:hypothetical protein
MLLFDELALAFSLYRTFYEISNVSGYTKPEVIIAVIIATIIPTLVFSQQSVYSFRGGGDTTFRAAPIATSGDNNVYVAWWTNKTGNDEVMFRASTDGGKTFGDKMNLSNSDNADSQDVEISAAGSNVYVSWWERNATSNEPVLRVSSDNGKTFGENIMLSSAK